MSLEGEEQTKKHSAFGWMIGIMLVLVIYVASTGPVICCYEKFAKGNSTLQNGLRTFYFPVVYAVRNNRECDRFFRWYLTEFWGKKIFGIRVH